MPIVNHLSYKMKESEDDHNRDVQLVGFARNAIEDPKPPTDQRLANVQMDAEYWKNNDGYDNQAFHRTEPSSLERGKNLLWVFLRNDYVLV